MVHPTNRVCGLVYAPAISELNIINPTCPTFFYWGQVTHKRTIRGMTKNSPWSVSGDSAERIFQFLGPGCDLQLHVTNEFNFDKALQEMNRWAHNGRTTGRWTGSTGKRVSVASSLSWRQMVQTSWLMSFREPVQRFNPSPIHGSLVMSPFFTSPNHDRYMVY